MSFLNKILKSDKQDSAQDEVAVKATPKAEEKKEVLLTPQSHKSKKHEDPTAYRIINKPLITEKATELTALNKYIFVVPVSANKKSIGERIFGIYGVKPEKINIIRRPGKLVRYGRRTGTTKSYKKAIVTLAPGDTIEVYEGV